ncbi:hypothetical protein QJS10_CPB20g00776 [Acorus calamus]|uniref:Uncharacterized protein n=1 Tax=Acorus calamus TaxID=4465 RepID=A0AAV9CEK5_ACOCL|nr:hypothetical protein QJS10_CPB20g00776 [Acorus calamus]
MSEVFGGGAYSVVRRNLVSGNGFVGTENQCVGLVRALGLSVHRFPLRSSGRESAVSADGNVVRVEK